MNKTPVVLDGRYVYAYSVYYGIAALWGLMAGAFGFAAIQDTGGQFVESLWPMGVGITSLILCIFTLIAGAEENYTETVTARWETVFTLIWLAIVMVLPIAVIYQFVVEADVTRAPGSVSTFLYLTFPTARWIYLLLRAKKRNG